MKHEFNGSYVRGVMKSAWKSDVGNVRENNEDSILVDEERGIFLLADGMGGHQGGEVASRLAVASAYDYLKERAGLAKDEDISRFLADALAFVHSTVFKKSQSDPGLAGMGTTLEMVLVKGEKAFICHVGDSRVYLFRGETLRQITTDDNLAALLAEQERIPPAEVPVYARHVLTQAVGVSEELIPEIYPLELVQGDILLLCSDGLNEMLADGEIEGVVRQHRHDLHKAVDTLVGEANARGGIDNISVVLVEPEVIQHVRLLQ